MEEKRPGQNPLAEQDVPASGDAAQASAPSADRPQTDKERAYIDEAQKRAESDRAAMKREGFGDHKGSEGF